MKKNKKQLKKQKRNWIVDRLKKAVVSVRDMSYKKKHD
jgi:hypothetical protein